MRERPYSVQTGRGAQTDRIAEGAEAVQARRKVTAGSDVHWTEHQGKE